MAPRLRAPPLTSLGEPCPCTSKSGATAGFFAISGLCTCGAFVAALHFAAGEYVSHGTLRVYSTEEQQTIGDSLYGFEQAVESRGALTEMITSEHLYERERVQKPLDELVDGMRRSIQVEAMRRTDGSLAAISLAFDYPDPLKAQRVTEELLASFVEQSHGSATTLKVMDAAELPKESTRNMTLVAANAGALAGLLSLGLLFMVRRLMSRKA